MRHYELKYTFKEVYRPIHCRMWVTRGGGPSHTHQMEATRADSPKLQGKWPRQYSVQENCGTPVLNERNLVRKKGTAGMRQRAAHRSGWSSSRGLSGAGQTPPARPAGRQAPDPRIALYTPFHCLGGEYLIIRSLIFTVNAMAAPTPQTASRTEHNSLHCGEVARVL